MNLMFTALALSLTVLNEPTIVSAQAAYTPWSGSYFPIRDGLLIRGPLRKYDLVTGKQSAARERQINRPAPELPLWHGYCHAWAAASVWEPEPRNPRHVRARNGQLIELDVGDQKGLLTACHADDIAEHYGERSEGRAGEDPHDIRPAHLWEMLDLYLGQLGLPLIVDVDPGPEVWNYPVFAYRIAYEPTGRGDHYRGVLTLWMSDDDVPADFQGVSVVAQSYTFAFRMQQDAVAAGSSVWTGDSAKDHPDFAWFPCLVMPENSEIAYDQVRSMLGLPAPRPALLPGAQGPTTAALASPDSNARRPQATTPSRPAAPSRDPTSLHAVLNQPLGRASTDSRRWAIEHVNERAPFGVQIGLNRADRNYSDADEIQVRVQSERAGYLYLLYCDAAGDVRRLFPNPLQPNHWIQANQEVLIPSAEADFRLRVSAPFGQEVLKAIVSPTRLATLELDHLAKGQALPAGPERLKSIMIEARQRAAELQKPWAEHAVLISTHARREQPFVVEQPSPDSGRVAAAPRDVSNARRIGVFIGVSRYRDQRLRSLPTAERDAEAMASIMREHGGLDDALVLLNEQATLSNVRRLIHEGLPAVTQPGDFVLLYWSGHGGRVPTRDQLETDGFAEYLIPYDGQAGSQAEIYGSMVMDSALGRWLRDLDGRQVIVVIDACHSGGQVSDSVKSVNDGQRPLAFSGILRTQTWENSKNIDQQETALLASSQASQLSFERRTRDLSVMTFFLTERLRGVGSGSVSLVDAAEYVRLSVPRFVEAQFPGASQTPLFLDYTTPPVMLCLSTDLRH